MDDQVGVVMYLHWERRLVQNMDVRETPLLICQVDKLRNNHWKSLLVHNLELK